MKRAPRLLVSLWLVTAVGGCRAPSNAPAGAEPPSLELELERADGLMQDRRYADAQAIYARALEDPSALARPALRWRALNGWARTSLTLGAHDDAKACLDELRALADGDPARESKTAHLAAAVLHREGDLEAAEAEAESSLKWARRAEDWRLVVDARSMLATVYSLGGRHAEALRIDEAQVAQLREIAPGSRELALEMNELGIDYKHFGRFGDALTVLGEALALYRGDEDIEGQAMVLYNMASVYSQMGDAEKAQSLKLDSLSKAEVVGHTYGLGLLNEDIGEAYLEAGNIELAKRHLDEALAINRSAHQAHGEIASLQSLGRLELEAGRLERSRARLREALTLAEEHGYGEQALTARILLSEVKLRNAEHDEALQLADEALAGATASRDPEVEFDALRARARALEGASRLEEAVAANLRAIALLESWRGRLALGDLRLGVARPRGDVFESAVRVLFALGRAAEAFEVSEHAKSRLLLELMADRSDPSSPEEPVRRLRGELRERFAALRDVDAARRAPIETRIRELTSELVALEASAYELSPSTAAARFPSPLSIGEVEEKVLTPNAGLLAYLWGERDVYGWWVGAEGVRGRRLGNAGELRALVEFLRLVIEVPDGPADWKPVAARAYRRFVQPLLKHDVREIRIVADGPLTLVPFEVMVPDVTSAPLGLTHVVSYGPSASVLAALSKRRSPATEGSSLLALAYSPPPAREPRPAEPGGALGPIPEAPSEARFITNLYRDEGARLLTGDAASFAEWMRAAPSRYRLLHFATHAIANETRSEESYLMLADGKLGASRIRSLRLAADLVTLSGCETALGYQVRGEGVVGLAHAFLAAGAGATLVSLWRVDDDEAATFMETFYGKLRSGTRPAEALFATRRAAVDAGLSHPAAWAAFVLTGRP